MRSIKFPGSNREIGRGQPQYSVIHAMETPGFEGEIVAVFELTDEEIEIIKETKRITYVRWTFGQRFQPMNISACEFNGPELDQ